MEQQWSRYSTSPDTETQVTWELRIILLGMISTSPYLQNECEEPSPCRRWYWRWSSPRPRCARTHRTEQQLSHWIWWPELEITFSLSVSCILPAASSGLLSLNTTLELESRVSPSSESAILDQSALNHSTSLNAITDLFHTSVTFQIPHIFHRPECRCQECLSSVIMSAVWVW